MNIIVQLGHPAHFHLYKNTIHNLKSKGHNVIVLIKSKDVLEKLLTNAGIPYINIYPKVRGNSKFGIIRAMLTRLFRITKLTIKNKVDLLTGSSTEIAQVAWLLRRHSIILGEDDAEVIPEFVKLAAPVMDSYLAPTSCDMGKIDSKCIKYSGYHKLAYLHPNWFTPDPTIASKYVDLSRPYFILRFVQLKAHHDKNVCGITNDIAIKLADILKPYGNVYITSERTLSPELEKHRLAINPLDIHHIMAFATLYIGDSQSMAVEAAMLGVPNIRFNDFVGKIGVLNEIEDVYGLTCGISANEPEKLYEKVNEWLANSDIKGLFQERRKKMLADKIDVTAFLTWFIETYPESKKIMKENPDYQYKFR